MDWSAGAAALLYGAASNLDTLILALSWGGRGGRLSPGQWGVIAGVTTGVTWCALSLGGAAAALTAAGRMLGAVVLVGLRLGLKELFDKVAFGRFVGASCLCASLFLACMAVMDNNLLLILAAVFLAGGGREGGGAPGSRARSGRPAWRNSRATARDTCQLLRRGVAARATNTRL